MRNFLNKFIIMKKTILLIFTAIIMLSSCSNNQAQQASRVIENVDAKKFKELVDGGKGIILDVRTPGEVAQGYINNASTINLNDPSFTAKINMMQKDKEIYVYCRSGSRSANAAQQLADNGFKKVYNLKGGINEWNNSGFPTVKPDGVVDENIKQMTLADFKKLLDTDKPVLVDFHTKWCAPCRKMAPVVDKLAEQYKDKFVVLRIDIDNSKEVADNYKIQGVPVFIIFKKGHEKWKFNGVISTEDLKKKMEENL